MAVRRRTSFGLAAAALAAPGDTLAQAPIASAEQRLRDLGIVPPKVRAPVANYAPYARLGNLVFLPGVGPLRPDGTFATEESGADVAVEDASGHARLTGLVLPAAMREAAGSLDRVVRVGEVFGMVNAAPDSTEHPKVINGCFDLFVEVFGDRGRHARSAVGMASLPFNITAEIEAVIEVA